MYKIVGADQKEYGPVTADQIRQWIAEARANGQTLCRFNEEPWKPLSTFPEFADALAAQVPPLLRPSLPAPAGLPSPTYASPGPSGPPAHSLAVTALVFSLLGFFCCGPIFSPLALVFAVVALAQINQNPHIYGGQALAIAAIVLAVLGLFSFGILLLTGVAKDGFNIWFHH